MIIPCIDLMDGKVVQLVQGREKVLERTVDEVLEQFEGFREIQVIDLDAAMERGTNAALVENLARRATVRVGGGVRTLDRARQLVAAGAYRVIVGTAAFTVDGLNFSFLAQLASAVGRDRLTIALDSRGGHIVVRGWKETTSWTARHAMQELAQYCSGFLCTYVDKEGLMQGTDLDWFRELRAATDRELIAAGGITTLEDVRALTGMGVHCAIGMSIYTGRLSMDELRKFESLS
jgi:phosphoribosylformimino-5-aminoimidazole carboxamide ribotide isomerase